MRAHPSRSAAVRRVCAGALIFAAAAATVRAQQMDFAELHGQALRAMNAEGIERLEFRADGWEACLGQPWSVNEGWARWELTDYRRVLDYASVASVQTAMRRAGMDPQRLGGCGAQPDAEPAAQQSYADADTAWPQQLQIWLTPLGFLRLAQDNDTTLARAGDGWVVTTHVVQSGLRYELRGYYDDDIVLARIETWIDDPVFGDMPFTAEFADYREFDGGLRFPSSLVQKQGGFTTLSLRVADVVAPTTATTDAPPRRAFRGGGASTDEAPYTRIAEGIYVINGAYQSVAVEFADYSVVIDGLQSDSRAEELIRYTKAAIPGKPIRYVISTHAHFDHANGLRQFVAEGATILTHRMNAPFFGAALRAPRSLNPHPNENPAMPVKIEGVGDRFTINDGSGQAIELYKLGSGKHADDMLIAYLPGIRTIVEADLLQPWINPVFGGDGDEPHPYLVYLADELERLELDYEQFVPVHRPSSPPLMSKSDLMEAVR